MVCFSAVKEIPPHLVTLSSMAVSPSASGGSAEAPEDCKNLVVKDMKGWKDRFVDNQLWRLVTVDLSRFELVQAIAWIKFRPTAPNLGVTTSS